MKAAAALDISYKSLFTSESYEAQKDFGCKSFYNITAFLLWVCHPLIKCSTDQDVNTKFKKRKITALVIVDIKGTAKCCPFKKKIVLKSH